MDFHTHDRTFAQVVRGDGTVNPSDLVLPGRAAQSQQPSARASCNKRNRKRVGQLPFPQVRQLVNENPELPKDIDELPNPSQEATGHPLSWHTRFEVANDQAQGYGQTLEVQQAATQRFHLSVDGRNQPRPAYTNAQPDVGTGMIGGRVARAVSNERDLPQLARDGLYLLDPALRDPSATSESSPPVSANVTSYRLSNGQLTAPSTYTQSTGTISDGRVQYQDSFDGSVVAGSDTSVASASASLPIVHTTEGYFCGVSGCTQAHRPYETPSAARKHQNVHKDYNNRRHVCDTCKKEGTNTRFQCPNHLARHRWGVHREGNPQFECTTCRKAYVRESHLTNHLKSPGHKKASQTRRT